MKKLTGNEQFTFNGDPAGFTVTDYWKWAYSDLLDNAHRGALAEFIVLSSILPADNWSHRTNWTPYDLLSPSGRRIEVKSSAYIQSWESDHPSRVSFDIAPKIAWRPDTGYESMAKRHSDMYVFCLYTAYTRDEKALNLDLWRFYVLPTLILDREKPSQKTITLSSLEKLSPTESDYSNLCKTIENLHLNGEKL